MEKMDENLKWNCKFFLKLAKIKIRKKGKWKNENWIIHLIIEFYCKIMLDVWLDDKKKMKQFNGSNKNANW